MSALSKQILQTVEVLPTEDQYQVLTFVESLWKKRQCYRSVKVNSLFC